MIRLVLISIVLVLISCNTEGKSDKSTNDDNVKVSPSSLRPNIIYILADDLGYGDLSAYGQDKFETPNIDALASSGILFTQHYSGSTVCAPSRSALLTGMHTGHTIIRGNKEIQPEGQYPMGDGTYTLAEMLQKAGYVTGAFGKWGLGFPGSEGDPVNQGFDTFYGYNCQRLGHHYYPDHLWSNMDSIVLPGNQNYNRTQYGPELIHKETLAFIEDNKDNPFFLYVPSIIPHAELAAPKEEIAKFRGKYPPEKAYEGVDKGPKYGKGSYASQAEPHATFVAMISLLDKQVGEIVEKVESLGLSDNTLIIFTSDNGPHAEGGADPEYFNSNGKYRGIKRDLYEGGIRVPMIASWPGVIKKGSTTDHVSAFWDVMPTLAEIASIDSLPDTLDGISFASTLKGNDATQEEHDYLYWEFHERGGRQAVRKNNWKAVKYNVLKSPDAPLELYNLKTDPTESKNIASQHPMITVEMERIMKQARTPSDIFKFEQETFLE